MKYFIFFLPTLIWASTYTVTEIPPKTEEQIAWEKVKKKDGTRKEKLKEALTELTTDFDKIKIKPLTDELAAVELYEEGAARQAYNGKRYAPVISPAVLKKRKDKLYKDYGGQ